VNQRETMPRRAKSKDAEQARRGFLKAATLASTGAIAHGYAKIAGKPTREAAWTTARA